MLEKSCAFVLFLFRNDVYNTQPTVQHNIRMEGKPKREMNVTKVITRSLRTRNWFGRRHVSGIERDNPLTPV